jgi:hypothetical protein
MNTKCKRKRRHKLPHWRIAIGTRGRESHLKARRENAL